MFTYVGHTYVRTVRRQLRREGGEKWESAPFEDGKCKILYNTGTIHYNSMQRERLRNWKIGGDTKVELNQFYCTVLSKCVMNIRYKLLTLTL